MKLLSNATYLSLLATPLLLGAWLGQITYQDTTGTLITVPVEGYDPRDLLHGHYINLRLKLPVELDNQCHTTTSFVSSTVWLCLDAQLPTMSSTREGCTHALKASCSYRGVTTNLTKFYIPEYVDSNRLDDALREGKGSASLLLSPSGNARLKQLFIENKPWSEWLERPSLAEEDVSNP